jgi:hypothetical protein
MVNNPARGGAIGEAEANPRLLACIRMGVGFLALTKGLALVAFLMPPALVMLSWIALSVALTVGWHGRRAAAGLVGLAAYLLTGGFYANHLYLLALVLLLVSLSDCERHYALRRHGAGPVSGWPLFLMRLQLSIVYVFAGVAKINGEFLSGATLGYHFENSVLPLPNVGGLLVVLSIATVAVEIFIGLGVWSARLRPIAFALVLPLHAAMPFVSQDPSQLAGIAIFSAIMLVLCASFLDVREGALLVVWNDRSEEWRRRVGLLQRLDLFGAFRFEGISTERRYEAIGGPSGEGRGPLQVFLPGWRLRSGVGAVREILSLIPGGCLVAPYLVLPGVRVIGRFPTPTALRPPFDGDSRAWAQGTASRAVVPATNDEVFGAQLGARGGYWRP